MVSANYVSPGGSSGAVGLDGDRVGFALAAKGVIRDSTNWEDSDGDGLPNTMDSCPNEILSLSIRTVMAVQMILTMMEYSINLIYAQK